MVRMLNKFQGVVPRKAYPIRGSLQCSFAAWPDQLDPRARIRFEPRPSKLPGSATRPGCDPHPFLARTQQSALRWPHRADQAQEFRRLHALHRSTARLRKNRMSNWRCNS